MFVRQSTPFTVVYVLASNNATFTAMQFQEAQTVTLQFLQDYVRMQLRVNGDGETFVDTIATNVLSESSSPPPPNITIGMELVFSSNSTFVPTTDEVYVLVESAFVGSAQTLLVMVLADELDPDNPFANVSTVEFESRSTHRNSTLSIGENATRTPAPIKIPSKDSPTSLPVVMPTINATRVPSPAAVDHNGSLTNPNPTSSPQTNDNSTAWNETLPGSPGTRTPSLDEIVQQYDAAKLKFSPFSVRYQTLNRPTSLNDTDEAARVTLAFLDNYLRPIFDSAQAGSYRYLAGFGVPKMADGTQIGFVAGVQVLDTFSFNISQPELDLLVQTAFKPPFLTVLLSSLRAISKENPFSTTTSVVFERDEVSITSSRVVDVSPFAITFIAISFFWTIVLAILASMYVRRKRSRIMKKAEASVGAGHTIYGDLVDIFSDSTSSSARSFSRQRDIEEVEIEFLAPSGQASNDSVDFNDPLSR
jgi:hypothetical protein